MMCWLTFICFLAGWQGGMAGAIEISDQPMLSVIRPPAPNIVFLMDNSLSMGFEVMMEGREKGLFYVQGKDGDSSGRAYVFARDSVWEGGWASSPDGNPGTAPVQYWETRCSGYNRLYYDPFAYYQPWPATREFPDMGNADLLEPKTHPVQGRVLSMKDPFGSRASEGMGNVLDSEMAERDGWWESCGFSSVNREGASQDSSCHFSSSLDARITYAFHVADKGRHRIRVQWPHYGDGLQAGEVLIRVYDHDDNILLGSMRSVQQAGSLVTAEVEVVSLNPDGPDLYVEISAAAGKARPVGASRVLLVGGRVEVESPVVLSNAHYFTFDDVNENGRADAGDRIFLVNFAWPALGGGSGVYRQIYEVQGGDNVVDRQLKPGSVRATEVSRLPVRLRRLYDPYYTDEGCEKGRNPFYVSPETDLQNYTNWFQYYRTRLHVSKAAAASVVQNLDKVRVGFHSLMGRGGSQSVLGLGSPAGGPVVIVDSKDGPESYGEYGTSVEWRDSSSMAAYKGSSRYALATAGASEAGALWYARIPEAGIYDVDIRWTRCARVGPLIQRDRRARYRVGVEDKEGRIAWGPEYGVNQDGGPEGGYPGRWNRLTAIVVEEGQEAGRMVVQLRRGEIWPHRPTSADAVRFVQRGRDCESEDRREMLFNHLYRIEVPEDSANSAKPLREALDVVGRYYATDLVPPASTGLGVSPYVSEAEGGGCQQAFVLIVTDGIWTEGTGVHVGDADGDGVANTLADVARYYYARDLAPDLPDLVPISFYDQNSRQHMVTSALVFGEPGRINPRTHRFWEPGAVPDAWPWPQGDIGSWDNADKMDDLFHATVNGRGHYMSAGYPEDMAAAMGRLLGDILQRSQASGSSFAVDSQRLVERMTLYQTRYYPGDWLGDLTARPLHGLPSGMEAAAETWSAAHKLSEMNPEDRKIISFHGKGFVFREGFIPGEVKESLEAGPERMEPSLRPSARHILDYTRGKDMSGYRERRLRYEGAPNHICRMGDMVHSAPVYHRGIVYVGSNNGMLHAVDAKDGRELFAFLPSFGHAHLWELMRPEYMDHHRYFVDGPITIRTLAHNAGLKDLLVAGLRKGGRGIIGMTLRDTRRGWSVKKAGLGENELVLGLSPWEFPPTESRINEKDMGYSFSTVAVVRSNVPDNPWVAVFGNGYGSDSGEAVLMIVNALTGQEIRRLRTGEASGNGLSSPAVVDATRNGRADWVYAGDLKGNMWKFDISSSSVMDWKVAFQDGGRPAPLFKGVGREGEDPQSITAKPGIGRHCSGLGYVVVWGTGKYLHGRDLENFDQQTFYGLWDHGLGDQSRGLGSLDRSRWVTGTGGARHYGLNGSRYRLVEQRVEAASLRPPDGGKTGQAASDVASVVASHSAHPQEYAVKKAGNGLQQPLQLEEGSTVGWLFDLPDKGERMVQDTLIHGAYAMGISFVPEGSLSPCMSGGYSWLNAVESCTGGRAGQAVFDVDGNGRLEGGKEKEDGSWEYNDSLIVNGMALSVSRSRMEGMVHRPNILHGKDTDVLLAPGSQFNTMVHKVIVREGEGLFYWRMR
ncbi:PilC/PilY family type IV pilus protein [Desulfobotulus sp. H1]|uniref:PilC/PilY family type IV pilus protein n=1 Tax=Desulfobotulus pelophilus TaxID=2823377 RepID=A0ABT3NCQ5_9BACT|nr:PilC/PilY family type IV pilus protein [Desulfobotulus pelophilus]MCW7755248.1 PilC/PilY family type IV pilus protein [Desulfobotulus pelophilus]